MNSVLVVDDVSKWQNLIEGVEIVASDDFLMKPQYDARHLKVFNLCKSYSYQTAGYYVSLLASARGQKVVPTVETILDMQSKHFIKLRSEELENLIQKSLKDLAADEFNLSIYFGKNTAKRYEKLANELHKNFNVPLLRAKFKKRGKKWRLQSIGPIGLKEVPKNHFDVLADYAGEYFKKRLSRRRTRAARFDLAILHDTEEAQPPSNEKALKEFESAANKLEIDVELITKDDFHRLQEFDGLFIRETTEVNHHTFRFAHKAQSLGLVVIDDPLSILRCTNKVYLAKLFLRHRIPAPHTTFVYKRDFEEKVKSLYLPVVLKIPDSSFSRGVSKAEDRVELKRILASMLEHSDVVLAQEFIPTDFDWRIGVLDGRPLYACKYFMARNHWQIYKQKGEGQLEDGEAETLSIHQAPKAVIDLAVRCCKYIGEGLYGVDIKEKDGKLFVIEINDNPSIDAGVEDRILKKELYEAIMRCFRERMEKVAMGVAN